MSRDHGLAVTFAVCLVHNTGPGCGAPGRRGLGVAGSVEKKGSRGLLKTRGRGLLGFAKNT